MDSEKFKQKMAELRESGVLSEAEYEAEKNKIVNATDQHMPQSPNPPAYGQQPTGYPPAYGQQPTGPPPAYGQQPMGYPPNLPQENTGLIITSYICAIVSLIFCPLVLGTIGAALGFYANSQGDSRGMMAGIVSIICMVIGMFLGMLMYSGI